MLMIKPKILYAGSPHLCVVHACWAVHGIVVTIQQLPHNLLIGKVTTAQHSTAHKQARQTIASFVLQLVHAKEV